MPKNKLKNVMLNEISFVDKGDNKGAHVMLLKRKDNTMAPFELSKEWPDRGVQLVKWLQDNLVVKVEAATFNEIMEVKELRQKLYQSVDTLEDSLYSIMRDEEVGFADKKVKMVESAAQFQAALTNLSKQKEVFMPKADKTQELEARNAELEKTVTSLEADKGALAKQLEELQAEVKKMKDGDSTDDQDALAKAKELMPESVRKSIEALEKAKEEQEAEIAKMKEADLKKNWVEKSSAITIGKSEDVATLLLSIAKLDAGLADSVHELLSTVSKQVEEGELFKAKGEDGSSDTDSAYDKMMKMAADEGVPFETVYNRETELRKQYKEEQGGK